jgi:hypothetical protein
LFVDALPFSCVESEAFCKFLKFIAADFTPPSADYIHSFLLEVQQKIKRKVLNELR